METVNLPATLEAVPSQSGLSSDAKAFELAQRQAMMLSKSTLVPKEYQGNVSNTLIALELANRAGTSPLMVMQNLHIIQGRPSWSSPYVIASINTCKKFSPLRFEITGEGEQKGCTAWAYDLATNDRLEGPRVTMEMARKEGWLTKSGSKWQTMPDLMMRYRSAAFFGRLYAPEIMMGMHTAEEVQDIVTVSQAPTKEIKEQERLALLIADATSVADLEKIAPHVGAEQQELFEQKKMELS